MVERKCRCGDELLTFSSCGVCPRDGDALQMTEARDASPTSRSQHDAVTEDKPRSWPVTATLALPSSVGGEALERLHRNFRKPMLGAA